MVNIFALHFLELIVVFILGMLIQGAILQASCALFNLLAGASASPPPAPIGSEAAIEPVDESAPTAESISAGPGSANPSLEQAIPTPQDVEADAERIMVLPGVPRLSLDRAMRVVFVTTLVNIGVSFIILRVLRLAGLAAGANAPRSPSLYLLSSPLHILVLSCMNALMLPTSFGKGLLIGLIFLFFSLLLAAILFGCVAIAMAFGVSIPDFL